MPATVPLWVLIATSLVTWVVMSYLLRRRRRRWVVDPASMRPYCAECRDVPLRRAPGAVPGEDCYACDRCGRVVVAEGGYVACEARARRVVERMINRGRRGDDR
jgi:hypothetical protein